MTSSAVLSGCSFNYRVTQVSNRKTELTWCPKNAVPTSVSKGQDHPETELTRCPKIAVPTSVNPGRSRRPVNGSDRPESWSPGSAGFLWSIKRKPKFLFGIEPVPSGLNARIDLWLTQGFNPGAQHLRLATCLELCPY
ncbi:hypothetical protein RRG08_007468 [Elysia crispata]|uniref:Uncharacterized protein n=1 Tax=Elysia crispata TaxID=231223 RepID=A0AAE0XMV6_9GAST|nr:hypothetical protein RRG08_007468 [Elysia crispata]